MGVDIDNCPMCEHFLLPILNKMSDFLVNDHPAVGKMMLSAIVVGGVWGVWTLSVHVKSEITKHGFKTWLANTFEDDGL